MRAIGSITFLCLFHAMVLAQGAAALEADWYPRPYSGDTLLKMIEGAPPPCPSAGDDISLQICSQEFLSLFLWTFIPNSTPWGHWLPPLDPQYYADFSLCFHEEGTFYYVVSEPGCPDDTAVVTVDVTTWDPCGWYELIYGECVGIGDPDNCFDDTILITVPPIPGYHDGMTYSLILYNGTLISGVGNYDLTSTFLIAMDSTLWYCCPAINNQDDDTQCQAFFNLNDNCIPVEPCSCSSPPNAGENNLVTICQDSLPFDLTTSLGGVPDPGGTWTPGLASGGNIYDPVLDGSGAFTYSVSSTDCPDDEAIVTVNVLQILPPVLSGIPSSLCDTDPPIDLSTIQNGITGNWSGTGVSNNQFNPEGLNGNITITFTPDPDQCALLASTTLDVIPFVIIFITGIPDTVCQSASPIPLPTTQTGITGNWSGVGVTNNVFNPNGLIGNIALSFTPDANECADPASATIHVSLSILPIINGVPDSLCQTDPSVNLPDNQSGISGGWSGNGVTNNTFNPAGLNGNILLTFTPDASQCASIATTNIHVSPVVTPLISGIPSTLCVSSPQAAIALSNTVKWF